VKGRISKAGDADVRRALYEAASGLMTRIKGKDKVKSWGQQIAKRSCHRKAVVAVAQAGSNHACHVSDGTFYVGDQTASETATARRAGQGPQTARSASMNRPMTIGTRAAAQ
jgi:hypothetical protein